MTSVLYSRSQLGMAAPKQPPSPIHNEALTLHYGGDSPWPSADRRTGQAFYYSTDHLRCAPIWRGWQSFHMAPVSKGGRGWNDTAYNSGVCPHGYRFEGRGPNVRSGANGTNNGNSRSCAVVYIAGGDDPLTMWAEEAFYDESDRYGVPLRWQHSDWKSTSCAGPAIKSWQAEGWPDHPTGDDDDMALSTEVQAQLDRIENAVVVDISLGDEVEPALKAMASEQYSGKLQPPYERYSPPWKDRAFYETRGDMSRDNLNNADRLERLEHLVVLICQTQGIELPEGIG